MATRMSCQPSYSPNLPSPLQISPCIPGLSSSAIEKMSASFISLLWAGSHRIMMSLLPAALGTVTLKRELYAWPASR